MNSQTNPWVWVGLVAVAIIAVFAYAYPNQVPQVVQQPTEQQQFGDSGSRFQHGISVGTNIAPTSNGVLVSPTGTNYVGFNVGTCSIQTNVTTIAASSSVRVDCQAGTGGVQSALTGANGSASITYGDKIVMSMSSTTTGVLGAPGLIITGADASSTAGYITLFIHNASGATFSWSTAASSSFRYFAWR